LRDRVEVVAPVLDRLNRDRLIEMLETQLADNRLAFELDAEGYYRQLRPAEGEKERNSHETFMRMAREATATARLAAFSTGSGDGS
jgi:polyphosphate kinase